MFTIKKIIQNTVVRHLQKTYKMAGDVKINRILIIKIYLFVLWRNSQQLYQTNQESPLSPQYRISLTTKVKN